MLTNQALVELALARCLPHWSGEFAIALHYFQASSPWRSAPRDRGWLEFQIWKEWFGSGVYGPRGVTVADILKDAMLKVQIPTGEHGSALLEEACSALDFGKDEFAHFTLLFDLWRRSFPGVRADVPSWGALPAGQALAELRYRRREEALGEIAVRLSEGGGLGLFFGIQHALSGSVEPFDQGLKRVVLRILEDERHHLTGNFVWASGRLDSLADVLRVVEILDEICAAKLREREEQFGIPLLEAGIPGGAADLYRDRYLAPMREEIMGQLSPPGGPR